MEIFETNLKGLFVINDNVIKDERGYLVETFKDSFFYEKFSFKTKLEIEVESKKNVLRGLHYQIKPYAQAKIIRVSKGSILDVIVDLREDSETYGKNYSIILNDFDHKQLYVSEGFAHGYFVISDTAKITYKMNNIYHQKYSKGIIYNDRTLNIDWSMVENPILSIQDRNLPSLG